jgi:hypothetical protein
MRDRDVAAGIVPNQCFLERAVDSLGRSRLLVTEKTPLRIGDGEVTGVFTCSIDVTDLDVGALPQGFECTPPAPPRLSGSVASLRRAAS